MSPTAVRMVLVQGEAADGAALDEESFDLSADGDASTLSAPDQLVSAILGTREGAEEAGYQLLSTGVTWSDQVEAATLRDALAACKLEKVMLVSAFLAAAALTQTVGTATDYAHIALLFVELDTATLAVVDTADGSLADVQREPLPEGDDEALAKLAKMVSGVEALDTHPQSLFVVGSGVNVAVIKPALEAATQLPVSTPEEPDMALAHGAALASANAPLFASSTAALAYARDPGTGAVDPYAVAPGYLAVPEVPAGAVVGQERMAYSAIADEEVRADAAAMNDQGFTVDVFPDFSVEQGEQPSRQPFLAAMSVLTIFVVGVVALVLAMALAIRPHVAQRPSLAHNMLVPAKQAPAPPPPKAAVPAPAPPAAAAAPGTAPVRLPVPAPAPPPPPPPAVLPILPRLGEILAPPLQGPPVEPRGRDHGGGG